MSPDPAGDQWPVSIGPDGTRGHTTGRFAWWGTAPHRRRHGSGITVLATRSGGRCDVPPVVTGRRFVRPPLIPTVLDPEEATKPDAPGVPLAHPVAVAVVKSVHTLVFLVMLSSILWLVVSGVGRRRDRSVGVAASLVAIEAGAFMANDGVCPLTPLAERLGATRGSVSDIFLPEVVARTIPIWSSALVAVGVLLHVRSVLVARTPRSREGGR
jgi:hypothetical protein